MPVISNHAAVNPAILQDPGCGWRAMHRIDVRSGDIGTVSQAINASLPDRLVFAEGDSWFDKFTPIPMTGTNLLDAIRTPFLTSVVDVSHIGDEVRDMVRGPQSWQTQALFKMFSFQAILLSAGGNDLKNVFADRFAVRAMKDGEPLSPFQPDDLERLARPASYTEFFDEVMRNIGRFVDLRNIASNEVTRKAPIFVHGYDYFQPRPAGARIFAASRIGPGPWLYPALSAAGLSSAEMRSAADAVIDEMNAQLARVIAPLANVHVIDQRGLLAPAAPGSGSASGDWQDAIHPSAGGFALLARNRWNVPLSKALGWEPQPGETIPAMAPANFSTASADPQTVDLVA